MLRSNGTFSGFYLEELLRFQTHSGEGADDEKSSVVWKQKKARDHSINKSIISFRVLHYNFIQLTLFDKSRVSHFISSISV